MNNTSAGKRMSNRAVPCMKWPIDVHLLSGMPAGRNGAQAFNFACAGSSRLKLTQMRRNLTQIRLKVTQIRLKVTQIRLKVTRIRLEVTQVRLKPTQIRLELVHPHAVAAGACGRHAGGRDRGAAVGAARAAGRRGEGRGRRQSALHVAHRELDRLEGRHGDAQDLQPARTTQRFTSLAVASRRRAASCASARAVTWPRCASAWRATWLQNP